MTPISDCLLSGFTVGIGTRDSGIGNRFFSLSLLPTANRFPLVTPSLLFRPRDPILTPISDFLLSGFTVAIGIGIEHYRNPFRPRSRDPTPIPDFLMPHSITISHAGLDPASIGIFKVSNGFPCKPREIQASISPLWNVLFISRGRHGNDYYSSCRTRLLLVMPHLMRHPCQERQKMDSRVKHGNDRKGKVSRLSFLPTPHTPHPTPHTPHPLFFCSFGELFRLTPDTSVFARDVGGKKKKKTTGAARARLFSFKVLS